MLNRTQLSSNFKSHVKIKFYTDYTNAILVKDTKGVALGWTVGGGLEVALNDHFTIKAEALYVDLGHVWSALSASDFKVDTQFATVRAGVNFKF